MIETEERLPLCLTVPEMAKELQIGISKAYELANSEGFPTIRFGTQRIRIPREALIEWLSGQARNKN